MLQKIHTKYKKISILLSVIFFPLVILSIIGLYNVVFVMNFKDYPNTDAPLGVGIYYAFLVFLLILLMSGTWYYFLAKAFRDKRKTEKFNVDKKKPQQVKL